MCKICLGTSKTKCMFCGQVRPIKSQLTPAQLEKQERNEGRYEFLRHTWAMMKKVKQKTSGSSELDAKLKLMFGEWL